VSGSSVLLKVGGPWYLGGVGLWRGVDDVNDRPVRNPKRRCDEHSSKFSPQL
jgi:hypothetical protein